MWGSHILKPPTAMYPHLPELEDLTMHLAELASIRTVPHALLPMRASLPGRDGGFAYITRRVDRQGRPGSARMRKLHMEDMAQVTERITEHKYRGSYEQVAKAIRRYAGEPNAAVLEFYEQVLFGFITGNADMHLKNFSLLADEQGRYRLAPAYDHVPTALVLDDNEELALTLNSRKSKLTRADLETAMRAAGLNDRAILNLFNRMKKALPKWMEFIRLGFIPEELQERYRELIRSRAARMEL
ncbi:MAG: HipA domain-containing protein [Flavobacteriales bacterium]